MEHQEKIADSKRRWRDSFCDPFLRRWCLLFQIMQQCYYTEQVVRMGSFIVIYLRILSPDIDRCQNGGVGVALEMEPGGPGAEV